jgi:hypothetical protein
MYHKATASTMTPPEPILRAEYGTLFRSQGLMMHSLHRANLFLAIPIPTKNDFPKLIPLLPHPSGDNAADCAEIDGKVSACNAIMEEMFVNINQLIQEVNQYTQTQVPLITDELANLLPNPIRYDEKGRAFMNMTNGAIWPSREMREDERLTLSKKEMDSYGGFGITLSFDKGKSRLKRAIFTGIATIVSGISSLVSAGVKLASAFQQHKANKARNRAIKELAKLTLQQRQKNIKYFKNGLQISTNIVAELEQLKDSMQAQDRMIRTTSDAFVNQTKWHRRYYERTQDFVAISEYYTRSLVMAQRAVSAVVSHRGKITQFRQSIDNILTAIDNLADGRLSSTLVHPSQLISHLERLKENLESRNQWELAFESVHQYYAEPLVTFSNTPDHILLQIPIFLKRKDQPKWNLYSMETVPVPATQLTYSFEESMFTQIETNKTYIAASSNEYVELTEPDLRACTQLGFLYLCEQSKLIHASEAPACAAALLFKTGQNIANLCEVKAQYHVRPHPSLLDAGNEMILANVPGPWTIACDGTGRTRHINPSAYAVLNKTELCECSLTAGPYHIRQVLADCVRQHHDEIFSTGYIMNRMLYDFLSDNAGITEEVYHNIIDAFKFSDPKNQPLGVELTETARGVLEQKEDREIQQADESPGVSMELKTLIQKTNEEYHQDEKDPEIQEMAQRIEDNLGKAEENDNKLFILSILMAGAFAVGGLSLMLIPLMKKINKRKLEATLPLKVATLVSQIKTANTIARDPWKDVWPTGHGTPLPTNSNNAPQDDSSVSLEATPEDGIKLTIGAICAVALICYIIYQIVRKTKIIYKFFPICPKARATPGRPSTDLYLSVANLQLNRVHWAHIITIPTRPERLSTVGRLTLDDVHSVTRWGCVRYFRVDWSQNFAILDENGIPLHLPNEIVVSLCLPLYDDFPLRHHAHEIRVFGRILGEIHQIEPRKRPQTSPPNSIRSFTTDDLMDDSTANLIPPSMNPEARHPLFESMTNKEVDDKLASIQEEARANSRKRKGMTSDKKLKSVPQLLFGEDRVNPTVVYGSEEHKDLLINGNYEGKIYFRKKEPERAQIVRTLTPSWETKATRLSSNAAPQRCGGLRPQWLGHADAPCATVPTAPHA